MKPPADIERLKDAGVVTGNWDFSQKPDGHAHQTSDARVAVIGEKEVAQVFTALGFEVFSDTRAYKVRETIKDLAEKDFTLILVTESCTLGLEDFIASYTAQPYPIILSIPDGVTQRGIGQAQIDANVKKVSRIGGGT